MATWNQIPEEEAKPFSWGQSIVGASPEEAGIKSNVIVGALGSQAPAYTDVYNTLISNKDDSVYRDMLYAKEMNDMESARYGAINEAVVSDPNLFQFLALQDTTSFLSDKRTNLEQAYAQNIIDSSEAYLQETTALSSYDVFGELTDSLNKDIQEKISESVILKGIDAKIKEADKGFTGGDVGDVLQQFIPGRTAALQMNELEGFESGAWLPGQSLRDTILQIKALPNVGDRMEALNTLVDNVLESSPDMARKIFTIYSSGMSEDDAFWDTFQITGFDALDVLGVGKAAGAGKLLRKTAEGAKTAGRLYAIRKGASVDPINPTKEIAEELGLTTEVATRLALDLTDEKLLREKNLEVVLDRLSGLYGVQRIGQGSTTLNTAAKNRIIESLDIIGKDTFNAIQNTPGIERLTPDELKVSIEATRSKLLQDVGLPEKHIINISPVIRSDFTNTNSIAFQFGRRDGSFFESPEGAESLADYLRFFTEDVTIRQQGGKYYPEIVRDIDESKAFEDAMTDIEIPTRNVSERSIASALLKVLGKGRAFDPRGVRYILSSGNMNQRLKALHGTTNLEDMFGKILQPLNGLKFSKRELKELDIIMNRAMETPNPSTTSKGVNYDTIRELEDAFFSELGKYPSENQVRAYYAYRQAMDAMWLLSDSGRLRDIRRVGGQNVELIVKVGEKGKKEAIQGLARSVDNIQPITKTNSNIAFVDGQGNVTVRTIGPRTNIADVSERLAKAEVEKHDIVQAVDGPLKIGDDYAHFIVSESPIKKSRVGFGTLGYNYGPLHIAQNPFWVKVPKFVGQSAKYYVEDLVHINAFTQKQADKIANALNRARLALKRDMFGNTNDEWKRIVDEELPHLTPEEFKSLYTKKIYDIDAPFAATRSGQRAAENINRSQLGDFADYVDSTSGQLNPLGDLDRAFARERMQQDVKTVREESLSRYTVTNAPKLSPREALNTGLRYAIPNRLQKDYLFRSINEILNIQRGTDEAIFKEDISKIWDAPLDFLHNPQKYLKEGISDVNYARVEAIRKAILRQVEIATPTQKIIDSFGDAMLEAAFPGSKTFDVLQTVVLPRIKDPFLYARKVAFTLSMGFWNIYQIPLQAQTFTSMAAISPTYTPHAFAAYTLQRMMLMTTDDGILRHFYRNGYKNFVTDDILKTTGFRLTEDQFVEMFESMRNTGWHRIGNEIGQIDGALNTDFLAGSKVTKSGRIVMDSGLAFFRGVERALRMTGWNIAYMEFRKANPTKVLTSEDIGEILNRADNLTTNMSAANNANWQRGLISIPTQFSSYQVRMMEQVLPGLIGRGPLTRGEAIRLLMMNSALFGAPSGLASAMPFVPWVEMVKKYAMENNIQINDTWFETLNEGFYDKFIKEAFGVDLDITNRYGFNTLTFFKDILEGDKAWWEVLAGPSGRALVAAVGGPLETLKNLMDYDQSFIEATDFEPLLDMASSSRHLKHSYIALELNRFVTKNNPNLAEVRDFKDALGYTLTQAMPDYATDTYIMNDVVKESNEDKAAVRRDISNQIAKALLFPEEQWDTGRQYLARARILAETHGLTKTEFNDILSETLKKDSSWERAHKLLLRIYKEKQLKESME